MPSKRPKPKWGHRAKGLLEGLGDEYYDEKQAEGLAMMLGGQVNPNGLRRELDNAANQYFTTRSMFEDAPTHAESKAALTVLQNHARSLLSGLQGLDDKSWNFVLAPETDASLRFISRDKVMTSLGYEIEGQRQSDGSITYEVLGPSDFVGAAEFIEFYLSHAIETFPKRQAGKRPLLSLAGWLNHIERIWRDYSGRDFTLNFYKGRVLSDAGLFCKEAIAVIDPSVTDANLITCMRDRVKPS